MEQFPQRYAVNGEDTWGAAYDACPHRHMYGYKKVKQIGSLPLLSEILRQKLVDPMLDDATQPGHLRPVRQYCDSWRRLNVELHGSCATWKSSWEKIVMNDLDTIGRRMTTLTQTWSAKAL